MPRELMSIVDCKLCAEIPASQHVGEPSPLPETWERLWTIDILESGFGAGAGDREELRVCRDCGTAYHWKQVHDPRFGEPGPPTTEWFLSRVTPHYARHLLSRMAFRAVTTNQVLDDSSETYHPVSIESLARDLARAPNLHIKNYMMGSLLTHYVFDGDWNGLKEVLIDTADPSVRVHAAYQLLHQYFDDFTLRTDFVSSVRNLLSPGQAREDLLIEVLADGLSQTGEILDYFTSRGYQPASVSGIALRGLRGVPTPRLGPAIKALTAELTKSEYAAWWREAVRDLLIEYVGRARERAEEVSDLVAGETEEAMAVRTHCQRCLE